MITTTIENITHKNLKGLTTKIVRGKKKKRKTFCTNFSCSENLIGEFRIEFQM